MSHLSLPKKWLVCLGALLMLGQIFAKEIDQVPLFVSGEGGYETYRIPGIIVSANGVILAYAEARKGRSDWGEIDILMRRSADGGLTWDEPRKIVTPPDDLEPNPAAIHQSLSAEHLPTMNNPVAIADEVPGVIHFIYCAEYARCFYMHSKDDGLTFSDPVEITAAFDRFRPEYAWQVLATGPGHGIQLENGRLLVPVWLSTGTGGHAHRPSAVSVIYSDDGGTTWERGEVVVKHPVLTNPSETAVVALTDGRVMLNMRHETEPRYRAVSFSDDGVSGWSFPRMDQQLPDPICMGSLIRYSDERSGDRNRLLFVNAHNPNDRARKRVSIKVSHDEGKSWPVMRTIEEGTSAYADLAVGGKGQIFCLYERGSGPATLTLARFDLEWLTDGNEQD